MKLTFTFLLAAVMGTAVQDVGVKSISKADVFPEEISPNAPNSGFVCYYNPPSGGRIYTKCSEPSAPFDVPPKEWDGPETYYPQTCTLGGACYGDIRVPVHHRTCEDKSRFLLMSEDNRWHCLDLAAAPPKSH